MRRFCILISICFLSALLFVQTSALQINVGYTYSFDVKKGSFSVSSSNPTNNVFAPIESVYGKPIGYCSFDDSQSILSDFTFSAKQEYSYVILPMYEFYFTFSQNEICTYWSNYKGKAEISRRSGTFTSGSITFTYMFVLYDVKAYFQGDVSLRCSCNLNDLGYFDLPVYAPQFIYDTDPSSSWDSLNSRLDKVESALSAIGNNLDNLNSTTERVLDEVTKERELLENPRPQDQSRADHVKDEYSRVQENVSSTLQDLSIPEVSINFVPTSLPDGSQFSGFLNFFTGLYPLNIIIPTGVGLWVVYLIIHGVRSS